MDNVYHKGDEIFLYTEFNNEVEEPKIKIVYDNDKTSKIKIIEDWTPMNFIENSNKEVFFNYNVPYTADYGEYQVVYNGILNGKEVFINDTFHIVENDEIKQDFNNIKIYGYIYNAHNDYPLENCFIKIKQGDYYIDNVKTNIQGYWEIILFPNKYTFEFKKNKFLSKHIDVQIGDEHTEIQFNNVSLRKKNNTNGNGIYKVENKYINKYGMPLENIEINIYSLNNNNYNLYAYTKTNQDGKWECYLNPGNYLMKISSEEYEIEQKIKINVNKNGEYSFSDINNVIKSINLNNGYDENNNNLITYEDFVLDNEDNPIKDVQIIAYNNNIPIAQDYTNSNGKYNLYLEPNDYKLEFNHKDFKSFTKNIKLKDSDD